MSPMALDTSVAVPFLMRGHAAHTYVRRRLAGTETVLTAHSLVETYSVLTRLPGDARVAPARAAGTYSTLDVQHVLLVEPG